MIGVHNNKIYFTNSFSLGMSFYCILDLHLFTVFASLSISDTQTMVEKFWKTRIKVQNELIGKKWTLTFLMSWEKTKYEEGLNLIN